MSRSYRKSPVTGFTCADSEKDDKRIFHRKFRHRVKECIRREEYDDIPNEKEVSNPYDWAKDGKLILWDTPRDEVFNDEWYKKLMRK